MRLLFEARGCGLGNNGGSQTILKSNEILNNFIESDVITNIDNFTWFKHKPVIKNIKKDYDFHVAVSCSDINYVMNSNIKKKCWWVRGHENWKMTDEKLIDLYNTNGLNIIVNSNCLRNRLIKLGVKKDIKVIYQGVDVDFWEDLSIRGDKIRIGCLYNSKHKSKRWDHFQFISKSLGNEYEYVSFGTDICKDKFLNNYYKNPTKQKLKEIYSSCHIWFAPTENEGLHNPPMEAALCGCLVICNDNHNNGMVLDYAFNEKTAMVYKKIEDSINLIKNPNMKLVDNMKNFLKNEIGSRESNMVKFLEVNNEF
jgi:hypothetical protein